ncbi:hypothetical protein FB567DRAFT_548242 [Paraphoma chrysanthemicola]|uniref:TPR-like protein n=1 Tax=Paraphoma chrysanthemicola TaxID=798071 RepID=A0A8K0VZ99_9PLEO|nr:hypothetical protein FB567DRAFT_548242 [Paraphoma chrysanthemicola]
MPSKDLSFLQDPTAYHLLPPPATPFQTAPNQPSPSTPLSTLLYTGHYRLAAISAARSIVTGSPSDHSTLLHLLHTRLACLCLLNLHALAAQESKVLGDLSSAYYRHPLTGAHLVPWDLRVLCVRLAALGYGEWRKGVMGYFELARECREMLVKSTTPDAEKATWRKRLRECGVRVASVLVEMDDLEGAGRHLATLSPPTASDTDPGEDDDTSDINIRIMETLVWLRVGDISSARRSLSHTTTPSSPQNLIPATLSALLHLADSDFPAATSAFQALHTQYPNDAMIAQNLAVCLVYTGRIAEAKHLLEGLVGSGPAFHAMVFNLSTVYELCTERNRDRKVELAGKLAARRDGEGVGWELGAAEFKLQAV